MTASGHPSDSEAQRSAEPVMREALAQHLGISLAPRRFTIERGIRCEVDAADDGQVPSVLAEIFARTTTAKPGQQRKVMNDALKLHWLAQRLPTSPRLLLVFQDEAAAREFAAGASTWRSLALVDLGVEVLVVAVDETTRDAVNQAQVRQVR